MEGHIDDTIRRLDATRRWSRWLLIDGGIVGLAATCASVFSGSLGFGLALGAGCLLLAASLVRASRRELIGKLAARGDAYYIPEVARYGEQVAAPDQRAALSNWLREAVESCGANATWYAEDRVIEYREEIVTLASEFGAPDASVSPESAVECKRLLTRMVESPLYNYKLPPENLKATLFRIRAGISSAEAAAMNGADAHS